MILDKYTDDPNETVDVTFVKATPKDQMRMVSLIRPRWGDEMKRYIRSSAETAWMVTFGQDTGNAETGPRISRGEYLIYAVSEDDACRKFEEEYAYDLEGYEGCWARRATQKEIDEWYSYMNEPEDLPFSSTRSKKRSIKAGYTGEVDAGGYGEGALRNGTKFNSWTDAYKLITDTAYRVIDEYGFDDKRINNEVSRLYSRYKNNRFFQKAYDKWCESSEEDW